MRILWQTEHYPDATKGGGSVTNTAHIGRALRALGEEVAVLARGDAGGPTAAGVADGERVIRLTPPRLPAALWPLWPVLEPGALRRVLAPVAEPFEAFVCHDAAYGLALKRLHPSRPVVFRIAGAARIHDACVAPAPAPRRSLADWKLGAVRRVIAREHDWMDRRAWRRADALIVQSEFMRREVSRLYGVPAARIPVVPSGVDHDRYAAAQPGAPTLAALGNPLRVKLVITFCGRLVRMKNLSYLLRAFARMASRQQCLLALAGEGEERPALEAEARSLGIASQVKFLGHVERVEEVLGASDIFVLPSTYEPFANALLEAMAAGLPCLALRPDGRAVRTSAAEILADGDRGVLVDPQDPGDLAAQLDHLVSNPLRRKEIGARAQAACRRTYRWETCARRYRDILAGLGGRP